MASIVYKFRLLDNHYSRVCQWWRQLAEYCLCPRHCAKSWYVLPTSMLLQSGYAYSPRWWNVEMGHRSRIRRRVPRFSRV